MARQAELTVLVTPPQQPLAGVALVVHRVAGAALHELVSLSQQVVSDEARRCQHRRVRGADLGIRRLHVVIVEPDGVVVPEVLVLADDVARGDRGAAAGPGVRSPHLILQRPGREHPGDLCRELKGNRAGLKPAIMCDGQSVTLPA